MSLEDSEEVVRALHSPFWEDTLQRGTKSAFQQERVSISRLSLDTYDNIVEIFKHNLNRAATDTTPERLVKGTAVFKVATAKKIARDSKTDVVISFVPDPQLGKAPKRDDPSHALMVPTSSKGEPRKLSNADAQALLNASVPRTV